MTTTHTTPTDPTVPPDVVPIVSASPETVPVRNPAGTWALVITTSARTSTQSTTAPTPHPWNSTATPATTRTDDAIARAPALARALGAPVNDATAPPTPDDTHVKGGHR